MGNGVTRGLQLVADWARLLLAAAATANAEAMLDAVRVGRTWTGETVDEFGKVRVGVAAILFGDPWRQSRSELRAVTEKWEGRL